MTGGMIWPPVDATASTAAANVRLEAGALHQRNRDRPVDHHVGHRAAGHGAEQARRHDRDLAGAARRVPGDRHREVHEQLAGAAALHERAEQHEQHHVGRRHAQRRAEDALGRQVQLVHAARRRSTRVKTDRVDQERDRGERQRRGPARAASPRARCPPRPPHRTCPGPRQVIDVDDAVDEVVVVEKDVQDEAEAQRQQQQVERRATRASRAASDTAGIPASARTAGACRGR